MVGVFLVVASFESLYFLRQCAHLFLERLDVKVYLMLYSDIVIEPVPNPLLVSRQLGDVMATSAVHLEGGRKLVSAFLESAGVPRHVTEGVQARPISDGVEGGWAPRGPDDARGGVVVVVRLGV